MSTAKVLVGCLFRTPHQRVPARAGVPACLIESRFTSHGFGFKTAFASREVVEGIESEYA
ncbi:hypothetical protein [Roseateles sp. L2-2]|uniref:hypothetical protein n=1 Tax=Roseateles TaxID=93681 RepID=UPI003D367010